MEHYFRHSYFVDSGVNIQMGREVKQLQSRFSFSDEMRKLLLIQSSSKEISSNSNHPGNKTGLMKSIIWYTLDGVEEEFDIMERNEDFIFSNFLFVFAQDLEGNQYAEITKGELKGHVVWLNALYYADVDSLEELIEENRAEDTLFQLAAEEEVICDLICRTSELVTLQANCLELFLCK